MSPLSSTATQKPADGQDSPRMPVRSPTTFTADHELSARGLAVSTATLLPPNAAQNVDSGQVT